MSDSPSTAAPRAVESGSSSPNEPLPPIDFMTFILSLSTSALDQMQPSSKGENDPDGLQMARQTIDILGVLQQKTRGNLTGEEERLLERVLYDLRLRFVEAAGRLKQK